MRPTGWKCCSPLAVLTGAAALAQAGGGGDPRATEQWAPVPPVVTPRPASRPAPPPRGAVVLLGETGLDAWRSTRDGGPARWNLRGGVLTVNKAAGNIETRQRFTNYRLHLEWRIPAGVTGKGQARGNSGVFLGATGPGDAGYELQILDSFANPTYVNGQAGAIYKQLPPRANPARPAGQWQSYDVIWTAPRFTLDGRLAAPARVTVRFNGVLVQNNSVLRGETVYIGQPSYRSHGPLPIKLQAHGDPSPPISFRNIWVRPLR